MAEPDEIDALLATLDPPTRALVRLMQQQAENQQQELEKLRALVEKLLGENAQLKQMLFGRRTERKKAPAARPRRPKSDEEKAAGEAERKKKRAANRAERKELPVEEHVIDVPEPERRCPCCGSEDLKALGEGLVSEQVEYVPAQLVRRRFVRRKYVCGCGEHIVTAPPPPTVTEGAHYGPGLHARVAVAKCADSLPHHRLAKMLQRAGAGISRSTLCDLFHRDAELLVPIYERMLELVALALDVAADETPLPVQEKGGCRRGYMWTFLAGPIILYVFSASRSGATPRRILGGTSGTLQVDAYSGYNAVTSPDGRVRIGCWAHARRKFFEALETGGADADHVLDEIGVLYGVEHLAVEREIRGTEAHRVLRDAESRPVIERLRSWLTEAQGRHPPKGPMGKAIRYALNNWDSLVEFLDRPEIPLDNNASERALRLLAVGRKNFLFAGHDEAAQNLAILQSLVSTCQAGDVNPQHYLADVLIRIQTHPASRIDELLPWNWSPEA